MSRPTLSLAMIVKNEAHNMPRLFESIEGCFDEIHITDTGSTDNTVEICEKFGAKVHHFTWVDDFAKARNYSFSKCTTDFIMWMDGDDVLSDKSKFILWRDNVMHLANYWLATYNYAYSGDKPVVSFIRERVIKRDLKCPWEFFIHEGAVPAPGQDVKSQHVKPWTINHVRTIDDLAADKGRNIDIIEKHMVTDGDIPTRLKFYYGKELLDVGRFNDSFEVFESLNFKELISHDRILALQYHIRAMIEKAQRDKKLTREYRDKLLKRAFATCAQAITLAPERAELYVLAGDSLVQRNDLRSALPFYSAAKGVQESTVPSALFSFDWARQEQPRNQIAKIYAHMNKLDLAVSEAKEAYDLYKSPSSLAIMQELLKVRDVAEGDFLKNLKETNDVVISTVPGSSLYEWDDAVYKSKGIGGSETAAVEIAENIAESTLYNVIVFNDRAEERVSPNGVRYIPTSKMREYFLSTKPKVHIAWRHNLKMTDAPTYVWCHDLITQGAEQSYIYDKFLCLTEFHKNYSVLQQNIPEEKIIVTRNGVNVDRFKDVDSVEKIPCKVMFPSSPDRGLDRAINICERARELSGLPIELNVFYGFDNMRRFGMSAYADELEKQCALRPWIKMHGNVQQDILARHFMESSVWLYPANFIETFCITAIESLMAKCFPLVREIGALKDTLKDANQKGMAKLLYKDAVSKDDIEFWANELIEAIEKEKWKLIDVNRDHHSWSNVAKEFVEFLGLNEIKCPVVESKGEVVATI